VKVSTFTGCAHRDYISLLAETPQECAALVRVGTSRFMPPDSTVLMTHGGEDYETVELRVHIGPPKQLSLDHETRAAIDATP